MRTLAVRLVLLVGICLIVVVVFGPGGAKAAHQEGEQEPLGLLPYYRTTVNIPATMSYAWDAVADPARDRLYVAANTEMLVFDTKNAVLLKSLELPYRADLIVLSRDGQRVYLTDSSGNGPAVVMIVHTETQLLERNATIPCDPSITYCRALSMATGPGDRLYIAADGADGVYVLDGMSGANLGTLPQVPPGSPEVLAGSGDHLYSVNSIFHENPGALNRWDVGGATPIFELSSPPDPARYASALAAAPDDSFLVVSQNNVGMEVVDSRTLAVSGEVLMENQSFAGLSYAFFQEAFVAADSRSILTHTSAEGGISMVELDRATLRPIRLARSTDYFPRTIQPLAGGNLAQVTNSGLSLLSPNDYVVALPLTFEIHCASGPIADQFDNPDSGWPVDSSANATVGYLDGEYQMMLNKPGRMMAVSRGDMWSSGDLFAVEGRLKSGEPGSFGIVFGLNEDWSEFYTLELYAFEADEDRLMALLHYTEEDGWTLVGLRTEAFGVRPGPEVNLLQMYLAQEYNGKTVLELAVNHSAQFHLPGDVKGRVGLIGTSSWQSTADLRFENYRFIGQNCMFASEPSGEPASRIINRPPLSQLLPETFGWATGRFDMDTTGR